MSRNGTLRKHERLHFEQQPYSLDFDETLTCWICQEELSGASQLRSHYDEHMKMPLIDIPVD